MKFWGKTSSVTITVLDPNEVNAITINSNNNIEVIGALTHQFSCIGTKNNGDTIDLTSSVNWNLTGIGNINANGLFSGIHSGGSGSLNATYGNLTTNNMISISNTAATLSSITISPSSVTIVVNDTIQFTATAYYNDQTTSNITSLATWNSSNTSYGTINSSGILTGIDSGITTISSSYNNITSNTISSSIRNLSLVSISISSNTTIVSISDTIQFTATGTYEDSSTSNITNQMNWNSSITSTGNISSSGIFSAAAKGISTISATYNNISSNSMNIQVNNKIPDKPSFTSSSFSDLDGNFIIDWNDANYAETYVLEKSLTSNFSSYSEIYIGSNSYYNVTSETDGLYYYRIKSNNEIGNSSYSDSIYISVNSLKKWQAVYGGSGDDIGYDLLETIDGGYIFVGTTTSTNITDLTNNGGIDIIVYKINRYGNTEWKKIYGGSGDDIAYSIIETSDKGYLLAGSTTSNNFSNLTLKNTNDAIAIKIDNSGNLLWVKSYGTNTYQEFISIKSDYQGNYILGGRTYVNTGIAPSTNYDYYLVKIDSNGNELWNKISRNQQATYYDNGSVCFMTKMITTQAYIVYTGKNQNNSDGTQDMIIRILSINTGDFITGTSNILSGEHGYGANAVAEMSDSSFAVLSSTSDGYSPTTNIHNFINPLGSNVSIKADKFYYYGSLGWISSNWHDNYYPFGDSMDDEGKDIIKTNDNGYLLLGKSQGGGNYKGFGPSNFYNVYLVKFNSSGTLQWEKSYGGTNGTVIPYMIKKSSDGVYIIIRQATTPIVLNQYMGEISKNSIQPSYDAYLTLNGNEDVYILKIDANGNCK